MLVFSYAETDSSVLMRHLGRLGSSLLVLKTCYLELPLPLLDCGIFDLSLLLRSFSHSGSVSFASSFGAVEPSSLSRSCSHIDLLASLLSPACCDFFLLVLDSAIVASLLPVRSPSHLDSVLLIADSCVLESSTFVRSFARSGSVLSAFLQGDLGSPLLLQQFSRIGLAVSALGTVCLEPFTSLLGAATSELSVFFRSYA